MKRMLVTQRGSMALFTAAFILPLLFFLFALSVDVATYYVDTAKTQSALDETAQYAYRFLPFQNQAREAALAYAEHFAGLSSGLTVAVDDSTVSLSVARPSPLTFARLVGMTDAALPLTAFARARGTPFDSFIVLDVNSYLAPSLTVGATPWGADADWPASHELQDVAGVSARLQTQSCFNPYFSALKKAAIDTYNYLGASSVNALGLGLYAGDTEQPLLIARPSTSLPQLPSASPEVSFVGYSHPYVGPSICAAIAERDTSFSPYAFPVRPTSLPSRGDLSGRPLSLITPGTLDFDEAYAPYLQGPELLWAEPVSALRSGSFVPAFSQLLGSLFAGVGNSRGATAGAAAKLGIWFAGDLPRNDGIRFGDADDQALRTGIATQLQSLASRLNDAGAIPNVMLLYLMLTPPSVSVTDDQVRDLQQFFDQIIASLNLPANHLSVRVIRAPDAASLTDKLSRWIALMNKTVVLSL